jgi:hypothetical protein
MYVIKHPRMKDYYHSLGITPDADQKPIKAAVANRRVSLMPPGVQNSWLGKSL